jgi:chromate reductase, NAD(P)H dehydrogenase (quinone)
MARRAGSTPGVASCAWWTHHHVAARPLIAPPFVSCGFPWYERSVRVLTVCGSLQESSSNAALLRAAASVPDGVELIRYPSIGDLPHFNPDLDTEPPLPVVGEYRAQLAAADALLIATPEYAHEMPGVLKNALDWVVGSGELIDTPVAIMSAGGGGGEYVLRILATTLEVMSARVVATLGVGGVHNKRDERGEIVDRATLDEIATTLVRLRDAVDAAP